MQDIPTFLPGRLFIGRGTWKDYRELAPFHYLPGRPATSALVGTVRYVSAGSQFCNARLTAVGVLSYPVPSCLPRRTAIGITGTRDDELRFANRHIRTISRVIVHPQFRSLGLSSVLVRWLCAHSPTRYVEALAVMGRAHPFFERAGMTRIDPQSDNAPVYFLFDRKSQRRGHLR